jgi:hypothetical protein
MNPSKPRNKAVVRVPAMTDKAVRVLLTTFDGSRHERLQSAVRTFLQGHLEASQYLNFTGTFLGAPTRQSAIRAFRHYDLRLNKDVLGRRFDKAANRLKTLPVLEGGEGPWDTRLHLHALTEIPRGFDPGRFAQLSAEAWRSMPAVSAHNSRHIVANDPAGWLDYLTKFASKPRSGYGDSMLWECVQLGRREAA